MHSSYTNLTGMGPQLSSMLLKEIALYMLTPESEGTGVSSSAVVIRARCQNAYEYVSPMFGMRSLAWYRRRRLTLTSDTVEVAKVVYQ